MNAPSWLGRLHVITDVEMQTRFSHEELGQIARESGADSVQYRDKRPIDREQHLRNDELNDMQQLHLLHEDSYLRKFFHL